MRFLFFYWVISLFYFSAFAEREFYTTSFPFEFMRGSLHNTSDIVQTVTLEVTAVGDDVYLGVDLYSGHTNSYSANNYVEDYFECSDKTLNNGGPGTQYNGSQPKYFSKRCVTKESLKRIDPKKGFLFTIYSYVLSTRSNNPDSGLIWKLHIQEDTGAIVGEIAGAGNGETASYQAGSATWAGKWGGTVQIPFLGGKPL